MAADEDYNKFRNRSFLSSNTLLIQNKSPFHTQCIPKETRDRVQSVPPRSRGSQDHEVCNIVVQEMIWKERCKREKNLVKQWTSTYTFLTEYDQYGDPKTKKEIPKEVPTVYAVAKKRPLTASREYGHRVYSPQAKQILQMQNRMSCRYKRSKDLSYQ